ncbi:Methylmalonate-semialdehyde dehydrogenase [Erysiphe pulchra]|uniref:methylmalonate-semialdehyde dehydrogenase (CoA acylating) n=1 Tax=Erysiphe pulchra TaxID=225359 RepID=A0A2S4PWG2_9PEZI|nr:Methylmalonate-semialdehyde dehydrogenase [Erysiphe pulchra]
MRSNHFTSISRRSSLGLNNSNLAKRLHVSIKRLIYIPAVLPYTRVNYPTSHSKIENITDTPWFIDNEFVKSEATQFFDVHDPATNNLVTRVPQNTDIELQASVNSAKKAFHKWKTSSIMARQQIMFKFTQGIRDNWDRLAASITLEQGKTLSDARADVFRGLQVAENSCNIPQQMVGEVLEVAKDMETKCYREPLGVVAAICPFNFPAMIPLWSIPIATATGNCLILKPSERDPGAAMILAEIAREAGFPEGVLNIVHGTSKTVDFIINEPSIKAISFRVQANLGAKNHAVTLPDADRQLALNSIVGAAFGAAGQRCMALSTLVMVGETQDWLADLVMLAKSLNVDGGFEREADLGPVISPDSKKRIEDLVTSAEDEGATILLDGRDYKSDKYPRGNWVGPTIITNIKKHMKCYRQEIFGPVLLCLNVDSLDEAVNLINANDYGNGVALFTRSGAAAATFQKNIEVGQIGINIPIPVPLPMFSFTGNKKSVAGGGASNFYGKPGLNFYTQLKTVTSLWKDENVVNKAAAVAMPTH